VSWLFLGLPKRVGFRRRGAYDSFVGMSIMVVIISVVALFLLFTHFESKNEEEVKFSFEELARVELKRSLVDCLSSPVVVDGRSVSLADLFVEWSYSSSEVEREALEAVLWAEVKKSLNQSEGSLSRSQSLRLVVSNYKFEVFSDNFVEVSSLKGAKRLSHTLRVPSLKGTLYITLETVYK